MNTDEAVGKACLTVDEINRFQHLNNLFNQMCKTSDDMKADKKETRQKINAYPKSKHNKIEQLASHNWLDHDTAFGGKCNDKVARKVMENPEPIYIGVCNILKAQGSSYDRYIHICSQ